MQIRLAIVEGHTLTRYGLRALAEQHPDIEIVAECASIAQASRVLTAARPNVVTVDVNLPDGSGLRLARELRDRHADLGIVVLTSQDEDDVLFRALETGVSAFVAKTAGGGRDPRVDQARRRRRLVVHRLRACEGRGEAAHHAAAARAQPEGGGSTSPARRRPVRPHYRAGDVHQPINGEDLRGAAVRKAGCGEPGTGSHDGRTPRSDPLRP